MNTFGDFLPLKAAALLCALACLSCSRESGPMTFAAGGRAAEHQEYRRLLREFEAGRPSRRWEFVPLPESPGAQLGLLRQNLASKGAAFDVIGLESECLARLAEDGFLKNLGDFFPSPSLSAYGRSTERLGRLGGKLAGIPWGLDLNMVYANLDLVGAAGFSGAPRDLDELLRYAALAKAAASRRGLAVDAFLWPDGPESRPLESFIEAYAGAGGSLAAVPKIKRWGAGPAFQALKRLELLFRSGMAPKNAAIGLSRKAARLLFQSGKAAFMRNGSQSAVLMQRDSSPIRGRFSVFSLPGPRARIGPAALRGRLLALGARCPSPGEGAGLIAFLSSKKVQVRLAKKLGWVPSHLGAYEDLEGLAPGKRARLSLVRQALPSAVAAPQVPGRREFLRDSTEILRRALTGDLTLRQAALDLSGL